MEKIINAALILQNNNYFKTKKAKITIKIREILTNALMILINKSNQKPLYWKLCIYYIKILKINFCFIELVNYFYLGHANLCH